MHPFTKLSKTYFEYKFLSQALKNFNKITHILDVGCGYGRLLKYINKRGYDIDGVEKNFEIVSKLRDEGYNIYTPEEFSNFKKKYDLIIMSHIIEHFQYDDLKDFMETYLGNLNDGGFLLIYTPTLHDNFYVDFDHVKPYHPAGIKTVFGNNSAEVQFYSKKSLKLVEFMYRRSPITINHSRRQLLDQQDYFAYPFNLLMRILYKISFSLISQKKGWAGLFQLTRKN